LSHLHEWPAKVSTSVAIVAHSFTVTGTIVVVAVAVMPQVRIASVVTRVVCTWMGCAWASSKKEPVHRRSVRTRSAETVSLDLRLIPHL